MTFVSYAQNFEDVMLWRALGHVDQGFYIDVGAQSPDQDSVTRAFSDAGWRGINVEPHPTYHAFLVEHRPRDINLQCALGEAAGVATIHLVGKTGLSTLDPSIAGKHVDAGLPIEQVEVEVETLDAVWDRHVPPEQPVHFLKVDVEGFELQVIRGNDWNRHRPWIVVVEATAPNSPLESFDNWEPYLTRANYAFVYADGLNRYYVAHEHAQLGSAFRHPPNVFDGFVMASVDSARREVERLEASLGSTTARATQLEQDLQASREESRQAAAHRDLLLDHLAARDARLHEIEQQLAARDARLHEIEQQLAARNARLHEIEQQLAARDARLHEIEQQLAARDAMLSGIEHQLSEAIEALTRTQGLLDQASARAAAAESEIDALRAELGKLYGSTSWRLTAPVRFIGRHLRRSARGASGQ